MKNFLLGLSLSVAFIIGCVTGQQALRNADASDTAHLVPYNCWTGEVTGDMKDFALRLNGLAKRGARLEAFTTYQDQGLERNIRYVACIK